MTKVVKGILIAVIAFVVLLGVVIGVAVGLGFYGWTRAVRQGNEAAAIHALMTISAVQIDYYSRHDRNFGTFDQLVEEGLLDKRFAGDVPSVDGYLYSLRVKAASGDQRASFTVNADPQSSSTGEKHFYIDSTENGVRVNPHRPASPNDPFL